MSNFVFLKTDWPEIHQAATQAEGYVQNDARTACFQARRALELWAQWLYEHDRRFQWPYDTNLNALLRERTFSRFVPNTIQRKADVIRRMGNVAVHDKRIIRESDALTVVKELFQLTYWLVRTYGTAEQREAIPNQFVEDLIPPSAAAFKKKTLGQLKGMLDLHKKQDATLRQERAEKEDLQRQLAALQAQLVQQRQANAHIPDTHDYNYSEAETRALIIDLLLQEAGWDPQAPNVAEYKVTGMPSNQKVGPNQGVGYVDYVLWGDDGLPLALVEAKRAGKDPEVGKRQAELYANCLEQMHGRRPIIFYTNGYETYLWDDHAYPPRQVQGFYSKDDLERLIQRRALATPLAQVPVRKTIVNRYYQEEAIRRISEHFSGQYRRGLLVMATGTGKTRTAIALVDLLMQANWVKRVLFLADRTALVRQALKAFKQHLPAGNPTNLLEDKEAQESRVVLSTYHTMMGQIDQLRENGTRRYGVGHFDLIIIDEAHRSVYQKFGAIFSYFDGLLFGLTATPRDEVDRNTYNLFHLEDGVPVYAYDLAQAVADEYLVPPNPLSVPIKFVREGIKYDDLSPEEQEAWELIEWDEEGQIPDEVSAAAINRWLFNTSTVDQVLQHLMENGLKVAGGDRLGKTIIFAKNHDHAEFILKRFDLNYPHYNGKFAAVIDNTVRYAQSLIDDFSKAESTPHIAISVDMLDTGIDVPEVVNLVFFKPVRSKTKFYQMIGRGTRLAPDLFGPGDHKTQFAIFDYCQNFEFFNEHPEGLKLSLQVPLSQRLFNLRLDLLGHLRQLERNNSDAADLATALRDLLHARVSAMPPENFIVRPQRRYVEKYADRDVWDQLTKGDLADLQRHVAALPSGQDADPADDEAAKRFDNLLLQLQLALIEQAPVFKKLQDRLIEIVQGLEESRNTPVIEAQMPLILALQEDEFWQTVSLPALEQVRLALRGLLNLIPKDKKQIVYTDFEDELAAMREVAVDFVVPGVNVVQYRKKVEQFIRAHEDAVAINKIRWAIPLDSNDLATLDNFFFAAAETGSREDFEAAFGPQESLAAFIRRLVGLNRRAAKEKFSRYLDQKTFTADQITFVNFIIDQLTQNGILDPEMLYDRPFSDIHEQGLDGVFPDDLAQELMAVLATVNQVVVA